MYKVQGRDNSQYNGPLPEASSSCAWSKVIVIVNIVIIPAVIFVIVSRANIVRLQVIAVLLRHTQRCLFVHHESKCKFLC